MEDAGTKSSRHKPKVIVYTIILLTMFVALSPTIYKKAYCYYCYGYYHIETIVVVMLIFSLSFSWWLWFMGLSVEKWEKGIPLFIGGASLILASYLIPIEDGSNVSWNQALFLIVIAWVLLHVEYCLPISNKIRTLISVTILFLGVPITCLTIVLSGIGAGFNSGIPVSKGIFFFPAIILCPFFVLIGIRKYVLPSCQKVEPKPVSDSDKLKFENKWNKKQ